jgi:hypothetical protein
VVIGFLDFCRSESVPIACERFLEQKSTLVSCPQSPPAGRVQLYVKASSILAYPRIGA